MVLKTQKWLWQLVLHQVWHFFLAKKYFWKAYSTNMIQYMINYYIIFSIHAIWFSSNLLFWNFAVERVPEFSGTQAEPNLIKQNIKFGVKSARYPTKYPTFWNSHTTLTNPTRFRLLLSDLFDTQLFSTRSGAPPLFWIQYVRNILKMNHCIQHIKSLLDSKCKSMPHKFKVNISNKIII